MAGTALEPRTDDEALVAAVRRGDDRAFELLYERYQRRIAAYAYGMLGDYGRAEDLAQEVFVSALRRMRATERPIAFKPWVYEIARNACIDQFRRSRRSSEEVSFEAAQDAGTLELGRIPGGSGADDAVGAKQQLDDLRGAFNGLSDAHHEILVMRELEGRSYQEIGERLGLSRPSVESTLFRARRRLTEEYEELVSGERCRRVSELLASGAQSLGARDEKRLARHVAHCQPCRRQAYAAGVDTATLTRHSRQRVAARVAALLPVPAFLRLRGSAAHWSNSVAAVAEPAAGWTKAVAAAAVLVAGGAGVAAQTDQGSPAPAKRVAPIVERQSSAGEAQRSRLNREPAVSAGNAPSAPRDARPAEADRTRPAGGTVRPDRPSARPKPTQAGPVVAPESPTVDEITDVEAPSANNVAREEPKLVAPRADPDPLPAKDPGSTGPTVNPVPADDPLAPAVSAVEKVNGPTGAALGNAADSLGLGG